MKRLIVLLVAVLAMLGLSATPATAAPRAHAATTVITFDEAGSGLPVADAAADWSKNTGISAVAGECTGTGCVHFRVVDFACDRGAPVGGCAYRLLDGSCQVDVSAWVVERGMNLPLLVTKHEAGHCVFEFGGISQSFHIDDPRALMRATHSISPTLKEATLASVDRQFTRNLFA